jgi:site-specific recombinase XerD
MTTTYLPPNTTLEQFDADAVDEAQLAALSFLARYSGRALEAYRYDLRCFFQWAADSGLEVLDATRAHIEVYRCWLEDRGLAPSTVDRRLSTVCGFFRFAHIDGRTASNPAQYVRRPRVHPSTARGLDRSELGVFLFTAERYDRDHAALAVLLGLNGLRVSEACSTNVEDLGFERGHRTLQIIGKGNKPAVIPRVPRTARTIDLAIGDRHGGPILRRRDGERLDRRTAHRWVASIGKRAGLDSVHPHMLRAAFIMAALDAGVPLRDVQTAARHADPRTTTIYDRRYGAVRIPSMSSTACSCAARNVSNDSLETSGQQALNTRPVCADTHGAVQTAPACAHDQRLSTTGRLARPRMIGDGR